MTIRQLLNHTSGIYDYLEGGALHIEALSTPEKLYTYEDRIAYAVDNGSPYFQPGTDYEYSNTNYVLLGDL